MISEQEWISLCLQLKQRRQEAGITQKSIGEKTAYSQQTISDFEQGKIHNAILLSSYCVYVIGATSTYLDWILNRGELNAQN